MKKAFNWVVGWKTFVRALVRRDFSTALRIIRMAKRAATQAAL